MKIGMYYIIMYMYMQVSLASQPLSFYGKESGSQD